jgi:hypothetical protein
LHEDVLIGKSVLKKRRSSSFTQVKQIYEALREMTLKEVERWARIERALSYFTLQTKSW